MVAKLCLWDFGAVFLLKKNSYYLTKCINIIVTYYLITFTYVEYKQVENILQNN